MLLCGLLCLGARPAAAAAIQPLQSITGAAERFVRAQMPGGGGDFVVTAGRLDPRLRLESLRRAARGLVPFRGSLQAQVSVAVGCRTGANWTIYVPVTVQSRIRVWELRAPRPRARDWLQRTWSRRPGW